MEVKREKEREKRERQREYFRLTSFFKRQFIIYEVDSWVKTWFMPCSGSFLFVLFLFFFLTKFSIA